MDTHSSLHQFLHLLVLACVDWRKFLLGLERQDPEIQPDNHAEKRAHSRHVTPKLEPLSRRCDDAGDGNHKCDEDHDSIGDTRCTCTC